MIETPGLSKYRAKLIKLTSENELNYTQNPELTENNEKDDDSKIIDINSDELFLVGNIDSMYLQIKTYPKYLKVLCLVIFIIILFNECLIWNHRYNLLPLRQYVYCYNINQNRMELVDYHKLCNFNNKSQPIFFYTNDYPDYLNFMDELAKISLKYNKFFLNHTKLFYTQNTNRNYPFLKNTFPYNGCVILTNYENNFLIQWNNICSSSTKYFSTLSLLLGFVLGTIILSFLSDILGRKRLLVVGLFISGLGCIMMFIFTNILKFLANERLNLFIKQGIYYNDKEFEFIFQHNKAQIFKETFNHYKIFYHIIYFFIFVGQAINNITALCLLLESSLNDNQILYHFYHYMNAISLSIFVAHALNYLILKNFEDSYLIIGIILIILAFIVIFYVMESPRYHYEFTEFKEITNILRNIVENKDLDRKYVNGKTLIKVIETDKMMRIKRDNNIIFNVLKKSKKVYFNYFYDGILRYISKNNIEGNNLTLFTKEELLKNPLILVALIFYEKKIINNFLILITMTVVVELLFYLNVHNSLSRIFFSRYMLYQATVYNSPVSAITIVLLASNYIFYILNKYIGIKPLMFICLISCIIISFINDSIFITVPEMIDQNKYSISKIVLYRSDFQYSINNKCIIALFFFVNGLFYSMFLYILTYTRTIYRCSFFGIYTLFVRLIMLFSGLFSLLIEKSSLFIAIIASIGVFTTIFLAEKEEYNIIRDKKKLEIHDNAENYNRKSIIPKF